MNEKDMGEALLNFGGAGSADAKMLTQKILDRDKFRVRLLLWFTVLVWLFAAALVLTGMVKYALLFPEQAKLLMDIEAGKITQTERDQTQIAILMGFQKGSLLVTFAVAKMCFAALLTVILVVFSRERSESAKPGPVSALRCRLPKPAGWA